jgi:DNA-binding MarR family transcriptional regulator
MLFNAIWPMTFQIDTSAGYLVNLMARLFARELEAKLIPLGLRIGAFPALLHLWEREGLTQGELVKLLDIEQPTLAATLSRMERDGLIKRTKDDTDGRAQRIWLTEKGRSLEQPTKSAAEKINNLALQSLGEAEASTLIKSIRSVIAGLHQPQSGGTD